MRVSFGGSDLPPDPAGRVFTAVPAAPAQANKPYCLMADDVVIVTVVNFTNLTTQCVVSQDGTINLPLLSSVPAAGRQPSELAADLTRRWSKYVINPAVSVSLMQRHKQTISVYGSVLRPGAADYRDGERILEAIASAGGLMEISDPRQVTVTRKSGETVVLDLSRPETKSGTAVDIPVSENDSIYVPEMKSQVSVVGEVKVPGSVTYKDKMTVLDALATTGGVLDTGDLSHSKIIHDGNDVPLDLDALLRKGDMSANITLSPGDRILVPQATRTYVFGAVLRPGFYPYKEGDRVLDAINGCGGTAQGAGLKDIRLVRVAKDKNSAVAVPINLERYFKKGSLESNALLQPGDAIYVPNKSPKDASGGLWGILSGLNVLNAGARILTHGLGN